MKGRFPILVILFFFGMITSLNAQGLNPPAGELFRDDVIPRIDISLPADSLNWLLAANNEDNDQEIQATFVFDNGTVLDTLEQVGFRLRGNTSRSADKKSFKISFNTFMPGREYEGIEKMNLNGQHNDPSVSRAKITADLAGAMGLPTMRTNHVLLYINGAFFGLYANVEHIDEEYVYSRYGNKDGNLYKCLYPADLDYKGTDPDLYKVVMWGRRPYDLKTNVATDDYSDLAHFIDVLNNTSVNDLGCELEKIFNVDQFLKLMVFDILTGNWDGYSYNKNNFYLYHNTASNQFEYIPYDLDNTMGIDWLGKDWGSRDIYSWKPSGEPRPLYSRLMQIPVYKDRFSYYMNECMSSFFQPSAINPMLDSLENQLLSWILLDPYYPLDYGFSVSDFQNAFDMPLPYFQTDYGIKDYILSRRNNAISQLQLNNISPIIRKHAHNYPSENQPIGLTVSVEDDSGLDSVRLCYSVSSPANPIICVRMKDDGLSQDAMAGDGIYGVVLPPLGQSGGLRYHIEAFDSIASDARYPLCGTLELLVESNSPTLAINEFLASNSNTNADPAGEFDDWIELYNYGNQAINLGNKFLTDDDSLPNRWPMPDYLIQPGEFLLFWADGDEGQGAFHTNFKLKAAGEYVGIYQATDSSYSLIDGLDFDVQSPDISFGRIPNGTGSWQSMSPTPAASNTADAIERFPSEMGMQLYPNPFSEEIILHFENPPGCCLKLVLLDVNGKKLWQENGLNLVGQYLLNMASLSSGIYFLSVSNDQGEWQRKKIIKH